MNPALANRWLSTARGVVMIAATYIYFLLFAQFAFLHAVQSHASGQFQLRWIMGAMAVGGLVSSFGTARLIQPERIRGILSASLAGCAAAALLTLIAQSIWSFAFVSVSIGIFLGALTVCLSASLPMLIRHGHRGLVIGFGTGLAYAMCNVPGIFADSIARQSLIATAVCTIALLAALLRPFPGYEVCDHETDEQRTSFIPLVILFLALVWLDSAAFAILQTTPELNQFGWGSAFLQWSNGGIHFLVAALAGLWLDRRGKLGVLAMAFLCLASAACLITSSHPSASQAHWLYASGVSLYSTALVFVPVSFARRGCAVVARRAGMLFGIAGWCGSVLGIGMAQDLHTIPIWFIVAAGTVVAVQLLWCRGDAWKTVWKLPLGGAAVGALFMGSAGHSFSVGKTNSSAEGLSRPNAAFGREVYIREGCIHCHSQFPRQEPQREQTWWGPPANAEAITHENPPLIGNRRQGPDLLQIGSRRSPTWNRLHLIDPQSIVPHSRMPSYAHLFRDGDPRGDALVAYLSTMGEGTMEWRLKSRQAWQPAEGAQAGKGTEGAPLFHALCAGCHGNAGDGHGPLANSFGDRPPRDLTQGQWQFIPRDDANGDRRLEIARVIKFGIPATSMPGHEMLDDKQLLSLARYVESLHRPPP